MQPWGGRERRGGGGEGDGRRSGRERVKEAARGGRREGWRSRLSPLGLGMEVHGPLAKGWRRCTTVYDAGECGSGWWRGGGLGRKGRTPWCRLYGRWVIQKFWYGRQGDDARAELLCTPDKQSSGRGRRQARKRGTGQPTTAGGGPLHPLPTFGRRPRRKRSCRPPRPPSDPVQRPSLLPSPLPSLSILSTLSPFPLPLVGAVCWLGRRRCCASISSGHALTSPPALHPIVRSSPSYECAPDSARGRRKALHMG